ncbi:MAG: low temperature requirement protein A [Nanoarchaeota archaeon]|nr:low temperature requirement protein A [Nanoarchaeota archaeon]
MYIEDKISKATWYELFFDLVFVASAHQLSILLKETYSFDSTLFFMLLFIPILLNWMGHVMFTTRFPKIDTLYHVLTITQIFSILFITVLLGFEEYIIYYFGLIYGISRFVLSLCYMRRYSEITSGNGFSSLSSVLLFSSLLWIISGYTDYVLLFWIVAASIDLFAPLFFRNKLRSIPVSSTHLPERLGLLTIIMLGEMILSTSTIFNTTQITLSNSIYFILGVGIVMFIARKYFPFLEEKIHGKVFGSGHYYSYTHMIFYISLLYLATGFKIAIDKDVFSHFLLVGPLLFFISYGLIYYANTPKCFLSFPLVRMVVFTIILIVVYLVDISTLIKIIILTISYILYMQLLHTRNSC